MTNPQADNETAALSPDENLERLGRDWPNLILKVQGLRESKAAIVIHLETIVDVDVAYRVNELVRSNRKREACELLRSVRADDSLGMRQFLQLAFDARIPVIGVHPWDLFGFLGSSQESEASVATSQQRTINPTVSLTTDSGPDSDPNVAGVVFELVVPFPVDQFKEVAELKTNDAARFKEYVTDQAKDSGEQVQAIIDAFLP